MRGPAEPFWNFAGKQGLASLRDSARVIRKVLSNDCRGDTNKVVFVVTTVHLKTVSEKLANAS